MLNRIKVLLGIAPEDTSKDELLTILLDEAEEDAKMITRRERLFGMDSIIERMVVYLYNRLGTEGLDSESYSGASYKYADGYPADIMDALGRYTIGVNAGGKLITY
jgi:hypothetical protein